MKYSFVVLALLGLISSAQAHKMVVSNNAVQSTTQTVKQAIKIATKNKAREEDDEAIGLAMDQNLLAVHSEESESDDELIEDDKPGDSSLEELSGGEESDNDKESMAIYLDEDIQLGADSVPDENMVMDSPPDGLVNMQMGDTSSSSDSSDDMV